VVATNNALKAAANGNSGYVNNLSVLEDVADLNFFPNFAPSKALHITTHFLDVIERALSSLLECS
jgi:hypothetical protein